MNDRNKIEENRNNEKPVRERLLEAAADLFSEEGFDKTSVRALTSEAQCNLAAVNYHFGGKKNLYIELFRRRMAHLKEKRINSIADTMNHPNSQLEDLLRSFAYAFMEPLVEESHGRRFVKLTAREMIDPHLPKDMFFEEFILPVMIAFQDALGRICPGLDQQRAQLAVHSFIAQLIHTVTVAVKSMFDPFDHRKLPTFDLTKAVNHIVQFSAAGIRACERNVREENNHG